jgi:hypothetical protein
MSKLDTNISLARRCIDNDRAERKRRPVPFVLGWQ